MSVDELAKKYGYEYKGSCFCDGYETHNWKHPQDFTTLKWRKYAQKVALVFGRSKKNGWFAVTELENEMGKIYVPIIQKPAPEGIHTGNKS
jgi:hypothetical protein